MDQTVERSLANQTPPAVRGPSHSDFRPNIRGKFLFVGEDKFVAKGVSYGAFRPNAEKEEYHRVDQLHHDFEMMSRFGINTVRIPHTTPPRHLLDIAQQHGLRVMVGLSAEQYVGFLIDTAKQPPDVRALVKRKVEVVRGHPALLCYAIGNEIPAPVARWLGPKRVERYLEGIYLIVKETDPTALVTYVNYPSTEYLKLDFLDLLSFNVYLEEESSFVVYLARLQNLAGDRPLIMSEIGLDALRNGAERQAAALEWQIRAALAAGCAGTVVFSWTDEWHRAGAEVEDWAFGITTREREPKPALAAVHRAYEKAPCSAPLDWPRVTVAICSFNGARTISDAVQGAMKLNYPNFEVIVVDDGSTDGTGDIAERLGATVIRTANHGLSSARNTAGNAASGEIISYIDDDAVPDADWLTFLVTSIRSNDFAAVGGPNIAPPNSNLVAQCVDNAPGAPTHVLLTDTIAEHIPGCNFAVRRSCFDSVGGFDPTFRVAGDDVDFCWRLQQQGWKIGFAPGAMVLHHRRNTLAGYWRQQRGYGKAEALLERKWPEKYNSAGHHTFAGRIYARGLVEPVLNRTKVYHGVAGFAPFQRLYSKWEPSWALLPLMPEWYLIIAILTGAGVLGTLWSPLLGAAALAVVAFAISVGQAVEGGLAFRFPGVPVRGSELLKRRCLTAVLHLLQPLARLTGRLSMGLTGWKARGPAGFTFPAPRQTAAWTQDSLPPEERLSQLHVRLRTRGAVVRPGDEYDRWDLEVVGGTLANLRVIMAVEEHGGGAQFVRVRSWPHFNRAAVALLAVLVVLAATAAVAGAWIAALALCSGALVLAYVGLRQAGQSTAAFWPLVQDSSADSADQARLT